MSTDLNDQRIDKQVYREPLCQNYSRCLTLAAGPGGTDYLDCRGCPEVQLKRIDELCEMKNERANACYALLMEALFLLENESNTKRTPLGHKIPNDSYVSENRVLWRFFNRQFRQT